VLNGLRQTAIRKAASFRWRALFWVFAAFAGVESPVGAQEAFSTKASLSAESQIKLLALAAPAGEVAEPYRPATPETSWIGTDSVDDVVASRPDSSFAGLPSGETAPAVAFLVELTSSAFNSRAPPALA